MDENGNSKGVYPQDYITLKTESGSENVHYSIFYESLPEEFRLQAQKKLNETPEYKQKGFKKLKMLLEKKNLACTDNELLAVLRSTKYNMKKAEAKLVNYLKYRQRLSEMLANADEKKTELILDDIIFGLLPYRDKDGRAVIFTRPNLRFDMYEMDDITPVAFATLLYILTIPLTTVAGISYIGESKADSLYIFYPVLKAYKSYIKWLVDLPIRFGRIDILNENFLIRWFYNAISPILPAKLTKRIFFNGNSYENLKKMYHPDLLPADFEGTLGPISDSFYRERLLNFIQELKAEHKAHALQ